MHIQLSVWNVLAAVPYVWEAVQNPMTQATAYRMHKQVRECVKLRAVRTAAAAVALTILICLTPVPSAAQTSRRSGQSRQQGIKTNPAQIPLVAGSFEGTLRSLDKKHIRVDVAEDQFVEFLHTHKTKFLVGDQAVDWKKFEEGQKVTVEATKEANGDLVALQVIKGSKKTPAAAAAPAKTDQP